MLYNRYVIFLGSLGGIAKELYLIIRVVKENTRVQGIVRCISELELVGIIATLLFEFYFVSLIVCLHSYNISFREFESLNQIFITLTALLNSGFVWDQLPPLEEIRYAPCPIELNANE